MYEYTLYIYDHMYIYLVGGLVAIFGIFPYIGLLIIPIDVHIFQRGKPTTNQIYTHTLSRGFLEIPNAHRCVFASACRGWTGSGDDFGDVSGTSLEGLT